jgi:hypothetical protein
MTEKLDKLSNDIITLLKNHEPNRLRHHEILDSLFDAYKYNYKDKKSFGVAITQKLKLLEAKKLIIHEDIWYGTLKSKSEENSFKASLMRHYQKMLGFAEELYLRNELLDARDTLRLLVHELPQPQREKIEKKFGRILYTRFFNYPEIENLIAAIIEQLGCI